MTKRLAAQTGLATLLLVVVLGSVLLFAVAGLAGQRQLELRALSGEANYVSQLLQAESSLAMAVEVERQLGSATAAATGPALINQRVVDADGHPEWPLDQLLEVSARSSEGLATATVRQWWWQRPLLKQLPLAPLMVQGSLTLSELAVAADGEMELLGLLTSAEPPPLMLYRCEPSLLLPACPPLWLLPVRAERRASADWLTLTFGLGLPWLATAPGFSRATTAGDCGDQLRAAGALWWRGDCLLDGPAIGSPLRPRLLVVEDGRLSLAADIEIHGLLVVVGHSGERRRVLWGERALLRGALLLAGDGDIEGVPHIWFDTLVLGRLQQQLRVVETVPGSWRDW
ncbi:MAG: hypothetical protein II007_11655 [Gammaproteobacteria bacterium]|nr:hypothetical protein [Gammaproteobacteria bacterium]